jgi:predicted nucleotidyltransferase
MKRNNIKMRLKEYFFKNPTKRLRVRQIEREVNIPLPSAIRYTKELEEEGILKREEMAEIIVYSADMGSNKYLLEKKLYNIQSLFDSGLIKFLIEELGNPDIILFGSFFKGIDLEESDIDLFVQTVSKKKLDLTKFEDKLQRKIQLFCHKKISFVRNKHLINNIMNGVTLNGFVEVVK